jgi:hypothetical protein
MLETELFSFLENTTDAVFVVTGESAGAILGHTTPRERRGAAEEK